MGQGDPRGGRAGGLIFRAGKKVKRTEKPATTLAPFLEGEKVHDSPMQYEYAIFVHDKRGREVMHTAPVSEDDARFLRERVLPTLQALDDETYLDGPAMILHTGARFSYVLDGDDLLWCVEWEPGLLVVRFSPDGRMAWTALRSPVPGFGGRKPLKQDVERYDEDADDPQYNLVFHAWDAQFDEFSRAHYAFVPASEEAKKRHAAGLRHPDGLVANMAPRKGKERSTWIAACQRRIEAWAGEGLRLNG